MHYVYRTLNYNMMNTEYCIRYFKFSLGKVFQKDGAHISTVAIKYKKLGQNYGVSLQTGPRILTDSNLLTTPLQQNSSTFKILIHLQYLINTNAFSKAVTTSFSSMCADDFVYITSSSFTYK